MVAAQTPTLDPPATPHPLPAPPPLPPDIAPETADRILAQFLADQSTTLVEIAQQVNLSVERVGRTLESPYAADIRAMVKRLAQERAEIAALEVRTEAIYATRRLALRTDISPETSRRAAASLLKLVPLKTFTAPRTGAATPARRGATEPAAPPTPHTSAAPPTRGPAASTPSTPRAPAPPGPDGAAPGPARTEAEWDRLTRGLLSSIATGLGVDPDGILDDPEPEESASLTPCGPDPRPGSDPLPTSCGPGLRPGTASIPGPPTPTPSPPRRPGTLPPLPADLLAPGDDPAADDPPPSPISPLRPAEHPHARPPARAAPAA